MLALSRSLRGLLTCTNSCTRQNRLLSTIAEIVKLPVGTKCTVFGTVQSVKVLKAISFFNVNDGSCFEPLQLIGKQNDHVTLGSCIKAQGRLGMNSTQKSSVELLIESLEVLGTCSAAEYPFQKKQIQTPEFLRENLHLRPRIPSVAAILRLRSSISHYIHNFFQSKNFCLIHTPILTSIDCEGGGEMFQVTSPQHSSFFDKPAHLTVSGQLTAESLCCALGKVYTFGPTFRAEKSDTSRHLAEFWMVEPEVAYADLNDMISLATQLIRTVISDVFTHDPVDISRSLVHFHDGANDMKLSKIVTNMSKETISMKFPVLSYTDAIIQLQTEINKDVSKWKYPGLQFGDDLNSEHEKWLARDYPLFIINFPKKIKPFYVRDSDLDSNLSESFDFLVPGVGEVIGGSVRENRHEILTEKMAHLDKAAYGWYLDLRKFGSVPHAGFGLGLERLIMFITGQSNIRDVVAFPRYRGKLAC